MKKKFLGLVLVFTMLVSQTAYANEISWNQSLCSHKDSQLLNENVSLAEDAVFETTRGKVFSTGILKISNEQNGNLFISVETVAHKNIDKIYQTVFLDEWDENREDWVQIQNWEFERTKEEEESGELSSFYVEITVSGCELNHYYRARAMHLVEWDDYLEGKATETNGVLLTDHEV